jgi:hypothetical protein
MAKKTPADTPDPTAVDIPTEPDGAAEAPPVHAHLAPVEEPTLHAATDDPGHPLHHHSKPSNVPAEE